MITLILSTCYEAMCSALALAIESTQKVADWLEVIGTTVVAFESTRTTASVLYSAALSFDDRIGAEAQPNRRRVGVGSHASVHDLEVIMDDFNRQFKSGMGEPHRYLFRYMHVQLL